MPRKRVLLVKEARSSTSVGEQDPYVLVLSQEYAVDFLPALAHRLRNIAELTRIIENAGHERYSGILLTSQRAVEAWEAAATASGGSIRKNLSFYVVGPSTAEALVRLPSPIAPPASCIMGAEQSGNAEKLASYICANHRSLLPLLYLVGDKRRDTISLALHENRIPMSEIQVYETVPSPNLVADFRALGGHFDWIVFFSPSGADLVLPVLHDGIYHARIAAIGPTTREHLETGWKLTVTAMANAPSPEGLLLALMAADSRG
ncbi:MAG: hypothetical protein CYPHOPRED_002498 [Cyphobasidiales sp. Tagirdzhanova-0007]|nr:MAG: hypothetical protein CYPHOPRED_002498 [Cyphobasidiales sp. Tagirdzhanova-0007]